MKTQGENIPRISVGYTGSVSLAIVRQTRMSEWSCEETSSMAPGNSRLSLPVLPLALLEIVPI